MLACTTIFQWVHAAVYTTVLHLRHLACLPARTAVCCVHAAVDAPVCCTCWQMLERINTDRRYLDAEVRDAMRTGAAKLRGEQDAAAAAGSGSSSSNAVSG